MFQINQKSAKSAHKFLHVLSPPNKVTRYRVDVDVTNSLFIICEGMKIWIIWHSSASNWHIQFSNNKFAIK